MKSVGTDKPTFAVTNRDATRTETFQTSYECESIAWERNSSLSSRILERPSRNVRDTLNNSWLKLKTFIVFLCEAEIMMDSQPMSVETHKDNPIEVLTPNQTLIMKSRLVFLALRYFQRAALYRKRRFKSVQYLAKMELGTKKSCHRRCAVATIYQEINGLSKLKTNNV